MKRNQKKFVEWLAKRHPKLAKRALREVQKQAAMGTVDGFFDTLVGAVQKIAPVVVQAKAQKDLLKVQMDRAKAGQPPLEAAQYSPGVQVEVKAPAWVKPLAIGTAIGGALLIGKKLLAKPA